MVIINFLAGLFRANSAEINMKHISKNTQKDVISEDLPRISKLLHLKFWGIPLGKSLETFNNFLINKGYALSEYNNKYDNKILFNAKGCTEEFLGYGTSIYLHFGPYSSSVYKLEIILSKFPEKKIIDIYKELYPLLLQKYGKPLRDDNIQNMGIANEKGLLFSLPEGDISLIFKKASFSYNYFLYLTYEDKSTFDDVKDELIQFRNEVLSKKEQEKFEYNQKIIKDI